MGIIIQFDKTRSTKKEKQMDENKKFAKLISSLTANPNDELKECTPKQAAEIAHQVLDIAECLGYRYYRETPIEAIIEAFGLKVFGAPELDNNASGVIYVNGTTKQCFGYDKVIATDNSEPFEHQRFVAAHELGHYLFDCLGNPKYRDTNYLFSETYPKNNHSSEKEIRADRFAAELLMPHDLFKEQYMDAHDDKKYNPYGNQVFIIEYLAKYFRVKKSSIVKRIGEVFYDGGF